MVIGVTAAIAVTSLIVISHFDRVSSDAVLVVALKALDDRDVQHVQDAIKLLQDDPNCEAEVTVLRGARSLFLDRPDIALREFADVTPTGQFRIPLLILTGEALYRVGQLPEAENCLQQAIVDAPDNAHAHRWMATVYDDLGRMDRALVHLEAVSRIEPRDFRPHRMRGVIYNDFWEYDRAETAFQQAVDLAVLPSEQTDDLVSLASVQMARKEFQAALQSLQRCQDTALVLSAKAECLWNLGDPDQAEKLLSQAENLGAVPATGLRLQARMLIERQKSTEAIAILQEVLSNDASDDESEYLLAMAYRLLSDDANYNQHLQHSEKLKALKVKLTALSQKAMEQPDNSQVRQEMSVVCDQLGLAKMAGLWRTAAAACDKKSANESTTP
ncbi:MAG: tetratricopeptide repeat protein [Planctomycetaceae bacterium]